MERGRPLVPGPAPPTAVFSALRHPNYRFYWLGQLVSVTGQTMEWLALPWLVFELTSSPISLGLTGLAQGAPRIALVLLGGVLADRVDRLRLVIGAHGLAAMLYLVLAALKLTLFESRVSS